MLTEKAYKEMTDKSSKTVEELRALSRQLAVISEQVVRYSTADLRYYLNNTFKKLDDLAGDVFQIAGTLLGEVTVVPDKVTHDESSNIHKP